MKMNNDFLKEKVGFYFAKKFSKFLYQIWMEKTKTPLK